MSKKAIVGVILLVAVCCGGYFIAAPYLTLASMKNALSEGDSVKLKSTIDFPSVRESLKGQFNASMMKKMNENEDLKNNPFGALGMAIASKLVDGVVDSFVTPSGIASISRGKTNVKEIKDSDGDNGNASSENSNNELFKNAKCEFVSTSNFCVTVTKEDSDENVKFIFTRSGLFDWKLTDILLPLEM